MELVKLEKIINRKLKYLKLTIFIFLFALTKFSNKTHTDDK